ncbi:MAG: hypothetical protein HXS44_08645 [Theionarchaea archaeon]|nr:hypothetical protein [Theionarchaea archaeon]
MHSKYIFILLILFMIQHPGFTVEVTLDKSFYQPGETLYIDVAIWNNTGAKECLQSVGITIQDPVKVLCYLTDSYPVDTECLESGEEKIYTFSCVLPENAGEGLGSIDVLIKTWGSTTLLERTHFEIGINYPPEITIVSYPPVVNPSQEYTITFSVFDSFGVEDLVSADVTLYRESRVSSERECYTYTWEKPDSYTVWKADSFSTVTASLQDKEIIWDLTFFLSEVASPGDWTLAITVYDATHQYHEVTEQIQVTKYLSFHLQEFNAPFAQINFGKAEPGENLPAVSLTVIITSNSPVNVLIQGGDLYSLEGKVLPADIFYAEPSTGGRIQLNGSRQALYTVYAERNGFNKEARIVVVFTGKLPEVVEAGTYSGIWYIIVEAV